MARVTGLGGIFIKARDPQELCDWYRRHLELDIQSWGGVTFHWGAPGDPEQTGASVWSIFPSTSDYFPRPFMVNFRVADLQGLLATLRAEGCDVDGRTESSEFGDFGWVTDPEGNRVELWQPPAGRLPG